jgi:methionine synthase I (cobalamin-dependent)
MALGWCLMDTDPRPASRPALDRLLRTRVLVCDGAMGTMLHSAGVPLDRSLSELNLARPDLVRDLHAAYLAAGADIVQTNTFDANRPRLARAGLQDSVAEINIAGARLAREAVREAGSPALVAGSVGPVMSAAAPRIPHADREPVLREQIAILASWVDLIILETFGDIESLAQAASVALAECDLPVIAQLTFGEDGRTLGGEEPRAAGAALAALKITAIGANCTVRPCCRTSSPGSPREPRCRSVSSPTRACPAVWGASCGMRATPSTSRRRHAGSSPAAQPWWAGAAGPPRRTSGPWRER